MKRKTKKYSFSQLASAVFMIVALFWLTISAPYVQACQQEQTKISKNTSAPMSGTEEEESNPFGNTTEEKKPSNSSVNEEYLHDHFEQHSLFPEPLQYQKCENAGTYIAYHGELLVPPPNIA